MSFFEIFKTKTSSTLTNEKPSNDSECVVPARSTDQSLSEQRNTNREHQEALTLPRPNSSNLSDKHDGVAIQELIHLTPGSEMWDPRVNTGWESGHRGLWILQITRHPWVEIVCWWEEWTWKYSWVLKKNQIRWGQGVITTDNSLVQNSVMSDFMNCEAKIIIFIVSW